MWLPIPREHGTEVANIWSWQLQTNFEEVAKRSTLIPNATAAYKKLWDMKRKFRAQWQESNVTGGDSPGLNPPTPKSPTKSPTESLARFRVTKPRSMRKQKVVSTEMVDQDLA